MEAEGIVEKYVLKKAETASLPAVIISPLDLLKRRRGGTMSWEETLTRDLSAESFFFFFFSHFHFTPLLFLPYMKYSPWNARNFSYVCLCQETLIAEQADVTCPWCYLKFAPNQYQALDCLFGPFVCLGLRMSPKLCKRHQ